jgi:cytochrome b561
MTTAIKYTTPAIWFHWIIAILIIFMLFPGEDLIKVQRGSSMAGWGPSTHATIGIVILVLSLARLVWRYLNPPPPLPATMPAWQVAASHAGHWIFYGLMIVTPLAGWFALSSYGAGRLSPEAVSFFNIFSLYLLPDIGSWTTEFHEIASNMMMFLIVLHVAAALKHQFWDRDGLLRRMSPH